VYDHDLGTASDDAIAAFADEVGAAVVSVDSDFATNLALSGKLAPSLVLFRSADRLIPTQQAALLIANLPTMEPELVSGAVVSLSPTHLRARRLPLKSSDRETEEDTLG
jgi:predicted nuclease of predicted toxin-antitoxin system